MATTSLGRLTLDLAVRLSEFSDGLSRAERETRDRTQEMSDSVGKFKDKLMEDLSGTAIGDAIGSLNEKLSSITEAFGESGLAGAAAIGAASIIGSVAAIGVGLVTLALQTAETDQQLQRLATRAKTSTTNLQVLTAATAAYGLEMDSVGDILADAQEKLGEFSATGGGGLVDTLELMQNATKKTDAELEIFGRSLSTMDSVDAIQAVVNEMEKADATTQEVRFVTESLASGLGDIIPLWDNNGEALRNYERDLNEAGVIRTKESIEQSQLLANELSGLKVKLEGVSNEIVTATLPAIIGLIEYMKTGTTDANGLSDSLSSMGVVAAVIATPFIGLMSVFKQVGTVVAGLMGSISALFSLMSNVLSNPFKIGTYLQDYANTTGNIGVYMGQDFTAERDRAVKSLQTIWSSPRDLANRRIAETYNSSYGNQNKAVSFDSILNGGSKSKPGGIPYRNGAVDAEIVASRTMAAAAEEEAKAKDKLAKSNDKAAKSTKELGAAYVSNTALSGLKLKSNEAIAGGKARGYTAEFAELTQSLIGGNLKYFSAINDTYHKGTSSKHATGQAFDIVLKDATKAKQAVAQLKAAAKEYGYQIAILDEYAKPSKNSTGGHLHVSVYGQKDNGKGGADLAWIKQQNSAANSEMQKAAQEAQKLQEDLLRRHGSIVVKYATEREKIETDHAINVTEIKALYAEGSANREMYLAREELDYIDKKNAKSMAILVKYLDGEAKLRYEHGLALKEIELANVEDDDARNQLIDKLNAAYQEDLENFRWVAGAKAREQDKMYQSIANSAKANGINAVSTGLDSMAQRTMSGQDYQVWRLAQDHDEAYDSVNNQYAERQSEINAKDERGKEILPELERNELLEIARQEHLDVMWAMEQDHALKQKQLDEQQKSERIEIYQGLFSGLAGLTQAFAGEQSTAYRVMFGIEKGFAIAQSVMAIQQSIAKAMSIGFPANIPLIAQSVAQGAQIVSSIKNVTAPVAGIAHGGLDYVPSESTYLLDKGERVLSPRQNKDLVSFMQGSKNLGETTAPPATPQNIQINNILDPSIVGDFMGTSSGTKTFINFIKNNRSSIKAIIS